MLCNEAIVHVYEKYGKNSGESVDGFVTYIGKLAFYTSGKCSLIFVTSNHFIEIDARDITVHDKKCDRIIPADYFGDDYTLHMSEEYVQHLFVGEHICAVKRDAQAFEIILDDFSLPIVKYIEEQRHMGHYGRQEESVLGFDRYLTKKCECGGCGRIWLDHVDDFFIRCETCHKSTRAHMALQNAIAAWNQREVPCMIDFAFEELDKYLNSTIHGIAICERHAKMVSDRSCEFFEAVLTTEYGILLIEMRAISADENSFSFSELSGFSKSAYPWNVQSTPEERITFIKKLYSQKGSLRGIKFKYGSRYLFLYAMSSCLRLTKSIADIENADFVEEIPDNDDSVLINEVYDGLGDVF